MYFKNCNSLYSISTQIENMDAKYSPQLKENSIRENSPDALELKYFKKISNALNHNF